MKTLPIVSSLVVIIVIVVGVYVGEKFSSVSLVPDDNVPAQQDVLGAISAIKTSIGTKHTYEGVVALPTPCHKLTFDTMIAESYPEQVTINFHVSAPDGMCAQVITEREFKVEVDVSQNHTVRATYNGVPVHINIMSEIPSGDIDSDDIELAPI